MTTTRCFNRDDATLLSRTAEHLLRLSEVQATAAETLVDLIAQARILPEDIRASAYVELNDRITYEVCDSGAQQTITLVAPDEADARTNRISFVSPVGLALIGMPVGEETDVTLPGGRNMRIRVLETIPLAA